MSTPFSVDGSVVIITGGNGFLGSQWRDALEAEGATVVVFDRQGGSPVDITDEGSLQKAVEAVYRTHGRIDGLVHAAAADAVPGSPAAREQYAPYEKFSKELWEREMALNLTAGQVVTQVVAPYMMEAKRGSIVFVSSELGVIAPQNKIYDPGMFKDIAYVSSKAGVLGLMRAWAAYLGAHNVRVNALVPGGMHNGHPEEFEKKYGELNMLGRMAKNGEYNGALQFLLSDASTFVTGTPFVIDGGRIAI